MCGFLLSGCGLCKDTQRQEVASPSGKYIATVFERDCGATTLVYTHVVLKSSGLHLLGPRDDDFVFTAKNDPVVKVQWRDDSHLTISYASDPHNVLFATKQWQSIEIRNLEIKE